MKMKTISGYRSILRAIGQGLENLDVRSFELEISGSHYIVSGRCRKSDSKLTPIPKKSFFGLIQKFAPREASPSFDTAIFYFSQLRFTRSDIELLDRKGKVLRSDLCGCPPNRYSTANVLRMVGDYLDHSHGRLVKMSWYRQILTFSYVNQDGIEVREVFTRPILHELRRTVLRNTNRMASRNQSATALGSVSG